MIRRYLEVLVARRRLAVALLGAVTLASLALTALYVRPDFAVELLFPQRSQSKVDYDRYKRDCPYADARALVLVEADDLFTEEGLARVAALERDLAALPDVIDTEGLTTIKDIEGFDAGDGDTGIRVQELFPRPDLEPAELARRRAIATDDPLFRWTLATPDAQASTIRVTLEQASAASDERRVRFLGEARAVLARHAHPGQTLTLGGLPVIRAQYTELIARDMGVLMPAAVAVTLAILFLSFRSVAAVLAAFVTIALSVAWTLGVSGLVGYPVQLLTQVTPIVVMIVSVSDTVHIVQHYRHAVLAGRTREDAAIEATHDSFGPCLLTEVVIALGFMGLVFQDILLISQFGLLTAAGMMLTWAANVSALPLLLVWLAPWRKEAEAMAAARAAEGDAGATTADASASAKAAVHASASGAVRLLERFLAWVDHVTRARPGRVALCAAGIVAIASVVGAGVGREYLAFDDLDPAHPVQQDIRRTEARFGGAIPLAVLIEPVGRSVTLIGEAPDLAAAVERGLARGPLAPSVARASSLEGLASDGPRPDVVVLLAADAAGLAKARAWADALATEDHLLDRPWALVHAGALDAAGRDPWHERGAQEVLDVRVPAERARLMDLARLGEPMLDPAAIALMHRVAGRVEAIFPEVKQASSAADVWRKVHALWLGAAEAEAEPLPLTRGAAAQELSLLDRKQVRDFLSHDHATAAVFAMAPDLGYGRANTDTRLAQLREELDQEERATGYRLTITGMFAVGNGIYESLVGGLALSLGFAAMISLVVFSLVLRSWRLGLIALVPNLLPLLLTFGVMAALGIHLKPTTVICFSITLVIADDDTIQFLVRYRRRFLAREASQASPGGGAGLHGEVASDTIEESGMAMLLTSFAISGGFLTLVLSEFQALQNLGFLIGVSLFTAVFADLFLSPLMLRFFRPRIGRAPAAETPPEP